MSDVESMAPLPEPELLSADELPGGGEHILELRKLFQVAVERGASDLHLTAGMPPVLRIHGVLTKLDLPTLSPDQSKRLIYGLLTDRQKAQFERELELAVQEIRMTKDSMNPKGVPRV